MLRFDKTSCFSFGGAESMPKGIPRQGHVAIAASAREANDAQLFAQSAHAPDQTESRPRLLHCPNDLTARTIAMMPVFHQLSRAEGPSQQGRKTTGMAGLRPAGKLKHAPPLIVEFFMGFRG